MSSANLTKAQRREAARLEAQRIAAANAASEARSKRIIWSILGVLTLVLVAAVLFVAQPWQTNPENEILHVEAVPLSELVNVPANTMQDGGFIITPTGGTTSELNPELPTLGIYFDYHCGWCYQFELINLDNIRTLAANQEANVVLHPVAILDRATPRTHFSTRSVAAAGWIAQYSPEHFLDFHTVMFANQPQETGGDMTNARIAELAESVGVSPEVAAGIADGTAAQTFGQWAASLTQATLSNPVVQGPTGGFGTPTITLNDQRIGQDTGFDWSAPTEIPRVVSEAAHS
jgi:protein-disulfide isomerase